MLLRDFRANQQHDYRGRKGMLQVRCFVPKGSPSWADDPQALWGAAEEAEKRKDSTVCRNFEVSLPHELDDPARWDLVSDLATRLVDRYGFAIQASSHEPPVHSDPRHFYAHFLATTRRLGPEGFGAKTRELDGVVNGRTEVEWIRAMIAERINARLAEAGFREEVEHRSLKERLEAARCNGIFVQGQERFEELLSRYGQEGRLLGVSYGYTAEQAHRERQGSGRDTSADEASVAKMPIMPAFVGRLSSIRDDEALSAIQADRSGHQDTH